MNIPNKASIIESIEHDDGYVVGALLDLEESSELTDPLLLAIADWYYVHGTLTSRQLSYARKELINNYLIRLSLMNEVEPVALIEEGFNNKSTIKIPGLQFELRPFQKEGVAYVESKDGRALIGDEMGLGKTVESLAYAQLHPEYRPMIIVCPSSVKPNWRNETKKWLDMSDEFVEVLEGKQGQKLNGRSTIYIINYDVLANEQEEVQVGKSPRGEVVTEMKDVKFTGWVDFLIQEKPKLMIIDECQYIKNNKAQRTKACVKLGKKVDHVVALSGTPIESRPSEFYTVLHMLAPKVFKSKFRYVEEFCDATHSGFAWDFSGCTKPKELNKLVRETCMIRRTKDEVLTELPEKTRIVVPVEIDNRFEYTAAETDFLEYLRQVNPSKVDSAQRAEVLTKTNYLKQLCVKGKMSSAIAWIRDFLDSGEKLVVFGTHKATIKQLKKAFGKVCVTLDGSTSTKKREEAVDRFQNDSEVRLFVGNLIAAGTGITLTAASATCFLELGWNPSKHEQAEDRVHRIGQTADAVYAYYLLAEDTVENEIAELLDHKREVLKQVLDGEDVEEIALLTELMKRLVPAAQRP